MALIQVTFEYRTGLTREIFKNARLMGSWDEKGRYSDNWCTVPMKSVPSEDGGQLFRAEAAIDDSQLGWVFHWGVLLDTPYRPNIWGIVTEYGQAENPFQHCDFTLQGKGGTYCYWLSHARRLGANKIFRPGSSSPGVKFSVWAPNAVEVATVIGDKESGYIWSDGRGVLRSFAMSRGEDGVWSTSQDEADLADFANWDHKPYMFRVKKEDGSIAYRTDLYSRCQIGSGKHNPEAPGGGWNGTRQDLDGAKSCSVVVDPERVTKHFSEPHFPENEWLSEEEFWAHEFDPLRPLPTRIEDLVIYELHVGALGFGKDEAGTLEDAMEFLDHLSDLGVNAVELLPMSEFEGWAGWGYGTSHYFAIEYSGGGRDQFKFFVRECHRHGIAVLLDVVYNHYSADAERAEWMYDSQLNEKNIYYWYQGKPSDYSFPAGGYLDNGSSGYSPNFREEMVRKMMTSSALALMVEFHVDGFRMDLTQAIHRDNVLHADGRSVAEANMMGVRFLREWVRTLRLVKPEALLIAEDHTGWDAISDPQETGGIGFDAVWWAEWYHHLIGDATSDASKARILHAAGMGGDWALAMDAMAGVLQGTPRKVVYHESHDEAGNSSYQEGGQQRFSARTLRVAVNDFLTDSTRPWAEARSRVAAALTILSAGTPMFFMAEEVGAEKPYRYDDFLKNREDIAALRLGSGARLFRFYQDLIRLRRRAASLRSPEIEVLHVDDANRVIAYRRRWGDEEMIVLASLNNSAFSSGYDISHPSIAAASWTEVLNSDADIYGGNGICNGGASSAAGRFSAKMPANGIAVFQKI